jgi:WD40 repeat protein
MKHLMNNSYKKPFYYAVGFVLIFIFSVIQSFADDEWELVSVIGRGAIYELDLSPDDSMLAVATTIGVWIYDSRTFDVLHFFDGQIESRDKVDWSPDSKQLAIGYDDRLDIWNLETGELVHLFEGKTVNSVAWSPVDMTIATSLRDVQDGSDRILRFWNIDENQRIRDIDIATLSWSPSGTLKWSPNGQIIAIGGSDSISTIDIESGEEITTFRMSIRAYEWPVYSIAWSPDSSQFATTSEDGRLRIWDIVEHNEHHIIQSSGYSNVAWSSDRSKIATGNGQVTYVYDAQTAELIITLEDDLPGTAHVRWYYDAVDSAHIVWSSDGKTLYTAGWKEFIFAWDIETGDLLRHTGSHFRFINTMAWSPTQNILATSSPDLSIRLWDGEIGEHLASLYGHDDTIETIMWSNDGKRLATGATDERLGSHPKQRPETYGQTLRIWDIQNRQQLFSLADNSIATVGSILWSADDSILLSASDGIYIWDTSNGVRLQVFDTEYLFPIDMVWSPQENTIIIVNPQSVWKLNMHSGEAAKQLSVEGGYLQELVKAESNEILAVVNRFDGGTEIWNVLTQELVETYETDDDANSLIGELSFDGSLRAVLLDDTIQLWKRMGN